MSGLTFIYMMALLVIVIIEVLHHIERRNLYRYIKADTLKEVDRDSKKPIERSPSGHREAIKKWRSGGRNE